MKGNNYVIKMSHKNLSRSFINLIIHISFHTFSFIGFQILSSDWSIHRPITHQFENLSEICDESHLTDHIWPAAFDLKIKGWKNTPRRGIEPRSPAWQAGILTTILSWSYWFWFLKFIYFKESVAKNEPGAMVRRWWQSTNQNSCHSHISQFRHRRRLSEGGENL